jgi:heat shock protein HslJ
MRHERPHFALHFLLPITLQASLLCIGVTCVFAVAQPPANPLDHPVEHGAQPSVIEGREWHLPRFYIQDKLQWPHRPVVSIAFANGVFKGSPGCGRFTGTYRRSDDTLTISAQWTDDSKAPCDADERDDAAKLLLAFTNVRRVRVEQQQMDTVVLDDEKGKVRIYLLPMQPGMDLSELHDTFWHLTQLGDSTDTPANAVINIDASEIILSTPAYRFNIPFQYRLSGLEFQTPQSYSEFFAGFISAYISRQSSADQQFINAFETSIQQVASYQSRQGLLIFLGKDQHPLLVLSSIQPTGIENRRWRIVKLRGSGTAPTDADGLADVNEPAWVILVNGSVDGSPGCGGLHGTYTLSGDNLTWEAGVIVTGSGCSNLNLPYVPAPKEDHPFSGTMRIEKQGDGILLRDTDGYAQMLLVP